LKRIQSQVFNEVFELSEGTEVIRVWALPVKFKDLL